MALPSREPRLLAARSGRAWRARFRLRFQLKSVRKSCPNLAVTVAQRTCGFLHGEVQPLSIDAGAAVSTKGFFLM